MMNNRNNNFFAENSFTFDTTVISNEKMEEIANYVRRRIDEIKTRGAHDIPYAIARPMHAPTSGELADNASAMKFRKSSPGILEICPMIRPRINEQNRPMAIWLNASTIYFLKILFMTYSSFQPLSP